ncbi:SDR family oxidoreductase [Patescibacteria group bacterium]|nr:SDR family oxidoreductase [Gammaproteobacteria bacterium]MBU1932058.1 SDR family oxidoreductase [Patescibacteria group bacterium]
MRILILGGDGMLGHKIFQVLALRFDTFATFRDPKGLWSRFPMYAVADPACVLGGVNALDFDSVVRAIARVRPTVVINCIGIIKQLKESQDPIVSLTLNSLFPHQLADLCDAIGARMFHVSTDCVFSGRKGNYTEDNMPDPEDLYGRTKLLGEVNRTNCLTVRTSIIGRDFLKRTGLLEWLLANRGGGVKGYKNAIYTGLPTQVLARIIGDVIEHHPKLSGLYHIASRPISKYDLLVSIRDALNLDIEVEPCDDPPCDRSLNPARFVSDTGHAIPEWAEMLAELAADPTPYDEWRKSHATT